jgi:hypothetical protein
VRPSRRAPQHSTLDKLDAYAGKNAHSARVYFSGACRATYICPAAYAPVPATLATALSAAAVTVLADSRPTSASSACQRLFSSSKM